MCVGIERVGQQITALSEGTKEVNELRDLRYGLNQDCSRSIESLQATMKWKLPPMEHALTFWGFLGRLATEINLCFASPQLRILHLMSLTLTRAHPLPGLPS
jgi:hypothetical protein